MEAPISADLLKNPIVQAALQQAWADSLPHDSARRHEEGGWVYMDTKTGAISIRRAATGGQALIDLSEPPVIPGSIVIAKFHTHPNPSGEGWDPGPSETDLRIDAFHGVPDLIQADNGTYTSGPERREGGLVGKPGYP